MDQVTLLGIQPENEHGHRFETDAYTWRYLVNLLLYSPSGWETETIAGLRCARDGAECGAEQTSFLAGAWESLVEDLNPGDEVAVTAVSVWRDEELMDSVQILGCPFLGISLQTIATVLRFLQGSHGFVIKPQPTTSGGDVVH